MFVRFFFTGEKMPETQDQLRELLRQIREEKLGSYEKAGLALGFNKGTIASYEKGQTLPDVDFLFAFADYTGADINELLRLRLACSKYESVRELFSGRGRPSVRIEAAEEEPAPPPAREQRPSPWPASFEEIDQKLIANKREDDGPFTAEELAARPDLRDIRARLAEIASSDTYLPRQQSWANYRLGSFFGDAAAFARFIAFQQENVADSMRWAARILAKEADRVRYNPPVEWASALQEMLLFGFITDTGCRQVLETLRDTSKPRADAQ